MKLDNFTFLDKKKRDPLFETQVTDMLNGVLLITSSSPNISPVFRTQS